ncbi:hypothetical protein DAH66_12790 [Sphingomonas koreensis]|uniref:Uncharacterized protein n=1 Tax=Sphingomonas koreensis TaxID=93064 RepID=A0A430G2E6_9SPHN|nr:hypothetical protein [Sphingomonas koreensis]RSY83140.1 hypothetical protein DAH66_12790 [Sphingomonas koreensis]
MKLGLDPALRGRLTLRAPGAAVGEMLVELGAQAAGPHAEPKRLGEPKQGGEAGAHARPPGVEGWGGTPALISAIVR